MAKTKALDLVYDRLVAEEKLKQGTKYERLAAIAFAAMEGQTTVHDLRLRGASGVRHQIDVTVGPLRKRLLVECKHYDKKVGLGIVRDFFGVVEDIKPDGAVVVTTVGFTRDAVKYAEAKGIRLVVLRQVQPGDLDGRVQRIHIQMNMTGLQITGMTWQADPTDAASVAAADQPGRNVWASEAALVTPDGTSIPLDEFVQRHLAAHDAYVGEPGPRSGTHSFDAPHRLLVPGSPEMRVVALEWRGELHAGSHSFEFGLGIGGLVAELALLTASGEVLSVLSNRQISRFSFDARGRVVGPHAN